MKKAIITTSIAVLAPFLVVLLFKYLLVPLEVWAVENILGGIQERGIWLGFVGLQALTFLTTFGMSYND